MKRCDEAELLWYCILIYVLGLGHKRSKGLSGTACVHSFPCRIEVARRSKHAFCSIRLEQIGSLSPLTQALRSSYHIIVAAENAAASP